MFIRRTACVLVLSFAFAANAAHAFFDPPWITPAASSAGELVSVNIHGGGCDAIFESPAYPQITQQGNAVRIVEYGEHEGFGGWCIYGIGTLTEPIGTFLPGDYTLTVDLLYDDPLYGPTIITVGVVSFHVTGASPNAAIPTLSSFGELALLIVVASVAACALRTRRRRSC